MKNNFFHFQFLMFRNKENKNENQNKINENKNKINKNVKKCKKVIQYWQILRLPLYCMPKPCHPYP